MRVMKSVYTRTRSSYLRPQTLTSQLPARDFWAKTLAASPGAETAASLTNILANISLKQELINQMIQSGNRTDQSFADYCTLLSDNFERGFTE